MICVHKQVKLSWKQYKMEIVTVEDLWEVICCRQNSDIVNVLHDFKSRKLQISYTFQNAVSPKNVAYITWDALASKLKIVRLL